ncbi:Protein NLRC3 [Pelomyxa schiedti]|nr:Protein NLRC3 [Pelomyxa schiedti]
MSGRVTGASRELASMASVSTDITCCDTVDGMSAAGVALSLSRRSCPLRKLVLIGNYLGDQGVSLLCTGFHVNTSLEHLAIQENAIGWESAERLMLALQEHTRLQYLDLSYNPWIGTGSDEGAMLAKALSIPTLHSLVLSNTGIKSQGAIALANMLETNTSLMRLILRGNVIDTAGAVALAHTLNNTRLLQLDIGWNVAIGDEGISAIMAALETQNTLIYLDISGTGISATGAMQVGRSLAKNVTLLNLALCGNPDIGEIGVAEIGNLMASNQSIWELVMSDVGSSAQASQQLFSVLQSNKTLIAIDFARNEIGTEAATALSKIIASNEVLRRVNLECTKLSPKALQPLTEVLQRAEVLQHLDISDNHEISNSLLLNQMIILNTSLQYLAARYLYTAEGSSDLITSVKMNNTLLKIVTGLPGQGNKDIGSSILSEKTQTKVTGKGDHFVFAVKRLHSPRDFFAVLGWGFKEKLSVTVGGVPCPTLLLLSHTVILCQEPPDCWGSPLTPMILVTIDDALSLGTTTLPLPQLL